MVLENLASFRRSSWRDRAGAGGLGDVSWPYKNYIGRAVFGALTSKGYSCGYICIGCIVKNFCKVTAVPVYDVAPFLIPENHKPIYFNLVKVLFLNKRAEPGFRKMDYSFSYCFHNRFRMN